MAHYLILAQDYIGPDALSHRMSVRPRHLEFMKSFKDAGKYIVGGARLNAHDQMAGSMVVLDFEDQAEIEAYVSAEPYIQEKVWEHYSIEPFKIAHV
jgi:uncharacterized protein